MIRPVLKRGDPRLYLPSQEITDIGHARELAQDLWDTLTAIQGLYDFTRGSGIAASQIGELWKMNAVEFGGQRYTLVNPKIVAHSDEQVSISEGCLSFFDYRGKVLRWANVTVEAVDENWEPVTLSSDGDLNLSSLLQHELGHNDGELYDQVLAEGEQLVHHTDKPSIP